MVVLLQYWNANVSRWYNRCKIALLPVNIAQNGFAFCSRVLLVYVTCHPLNKMILERSFDKLV